MFNSGWGATEFLSLRARGMLFAPTPRRDSGEFTGDCAICDADGSKADRKSEKVVFVCLGMALLTLCYPAVKKIKLNAGLWLSSVFAAALWQSTAMALKAARDIYFKSCLSGVSITQNLR